MQAFPASAPSRSSRRSPASHAIGCTAARCRTRGRHPPPPLRWRAALVSQPDNKGDVQMRRLAALVVLLSFSVVCTVPCAWAWTWPVAGPVLTPFSFDAARPYAGGQHRGIDIGAAAGAGVAAPVAGTVTFAGTVPTSGKTLSLLTADALAVTLTHLGSLT